MIIPMAKVRIVGPKSLFESVTDLLQALGVLHIESLPSGMEARRLERFSLDRGHEKKKAELERMLKELNRLVLALPESMAAYMQPARAETSSRMDDDVLGEIREELDTVGGQIDSILKRIRECEEEHSLLLKYEHVLEAMAPLLEQIRDVKGLDFLGLVLEVPAVEPSESSDRKAVLQEIRDALSELTGNRYELFLSRIDPETLAGLLVIPRELSSRIRAFLWEENISELRLPSSMADKPVGLALKMLLQRRAEIPIQLQKFRSSLFDLSLQWRGRFQNYKTVVDNWLAQLKSTLYFYQTRSTFVVYGWIPERDFPGVQKRLMDTFQGGVVMERINIERDELKAIPVALRNPGLVKPFETFTKLISLPSYGSIDPTPYLALFFPLFYGIILGDIGYGITLLGLSLYIRRRWRSHLLVRNLSVIFILSSLSAIFFGILYGEFFGDLGEPLGIHPILLNRMEGFLLFLKVTIGIGLIHILLGIVLGFITAFRHHDAREMAIKGNGLLFFLGILLVITALVGLIARPYATAGGIVALISLILLFIFGGARAAMELHNVVNVLSYLRLMGIGVASAALAFAANTLGALVGNIVLAITIMLFFHLINLVFGIFSPTVQSLRLHYVEFFENFFQAGGREYRPFRRI
jgi:V/A-type H+/Na+-transporting ATPase subunit I